MKRKSKFYLSVWLAVLLAIAWLIGFPLFLNAWAPSHWARTPCHIAGEGRYFYEINGITYNTTRRDFWQRPVVWSRESHALSFVANGECWVNPRDPEDVVLKLDASSNFSNAGGRIAGAALVLATGTAFSLLQYRRNRAARNSTPASAQ